MDKKWWKEGVVYQIYPRSFNDSNGDGIGDLKGIIEKIPYLQELGIDIIWICPVYKSPNDDNGYDISDYKDIMDEFGTMEDMDELLSELHAAGIKIIMDLVVNHTSDEHPWFIEARKSKESSYRDYYFWKKGKAGVPPSNWRGCFGGSAWEYDEASDEYYLHLFTKKQPDLNWNNKNVREDIYSMVRWWIDKGIDGFRLDAINSISKEESIMQELPETGEAVWAGYYFNTGTSVHDFLKELNENVFSDYDIMTVGETPGVTPQEGLLYCDPQRKELNMIFQFELMDIDVGPKGKWEIVPWSVDTFKDIMTKWQYQLYDKGWNSLFMNNHDLPRMVSRFGNDKKYRAESAKLLATILHTMQGTPYIYQGEELGMTNVAFDSIDQYRDVDTLNAYREFKEENLSEAEIMDLIHRKSRDNSRTPMQWNSSTNAGFTDGIPWIDLNPNYKEINAESEMNNPNSVFNYYKQLIRMRKKYPVVVYGKYSLIKDCKSPLYVYTREYTSQHLLIVLNFTEQHTEMDHRCREISHHKGYELILSNYSEIDHTSVFLRPYEARVYYNSLPQ